MHEWTETIRTGGNLSADSVAGAVGWLVDEAVSAEDKADFLTAFAKKGETAQEITAFAKELRSRSTLLPLPEGLFHTNELLDVCGTGGDRLNTFNISTTVGLLCAGAGVFVAKHGNRAVTSSSGSADVLEALGIPINLSPAAAGLALQQHGFAFLFAPQFHPAFKGIGAARKLCATRGQRTIPAIWS